MDELAATRDEKEIFGSCSNSKLFFMGSLLYLPYRADSLNSLDDRTDGPA